MTSTWIKRIALALGAALALPATAVAVLLATFDANAHKQLAIDWMQAQHQRTLAIDGPITLTFWPRLSAKVSRVRLSERGRADEFAAIDEATLAVQVLPLLRGQLVVGAVGAKGVRVAWLRDADGRRNVDDLLASDTPSAPEPGKPATSSRPLRFDVSALRLADLRLRLNDVPRHLAGELVLQSFTAGRLANQAQAPVSLRATLNLTQPEPVALTLDGQMTLALDLDKGTAAASDLQMDLQGNGPAGIQQLALALNGALAWDGQALRAGPLALTLRSASRGPTVLGASSLKLKDAVLTPTPQRLQASGLLLNLSGQQAGAPFELAVDWPQLMADTQQFSGSALSGRVALAGATRLTGQFKAAGPAGTLDSLRLPGLDIALAVHSGERQLDGRLLTDLTLQAERGAATLAAIDLQLKVADPGLQPLALQLKGQADASAQAAHWALTGALNNNQLATRGDAVLGGAVPLVRATLQADSLDINKLLAPGKPAPATTTATAPADTPLPLAGLKALNAEIGITAGALAFRQYRVADAVLNARLDNGRLTVAPLTGRAWGGRFKASGSADAHSQQVAVQLDAEGVNVNALLKDVAAKDLLEGQGHVVADLRSNGATVGALRSHLAGSAALQLRDGAVKGFNLAKALRQAQAALSLRQDAVAKANATEQTDFSELRVSAHIADGVAQSDDLDVRSPFLRIGGAGRFDIGRGRVDYTARATVIASAAGQGAGTDALRGITVPVLLAGPFDAIDWQIQWSGVAASVIKGQLQDKLTGALGRQLGLPGGAASAPGTARDARDALKNSLKGLLR
jgi:AsmA protein